MLPLVLGPLGVEAVSAHAFAPLERDGTKASLRGLIGQTKKLVSAVGADLGAVFDRAAERLYLIDESGHEIPVEQALLLFLRLIGSDGRRGKLAFPVTVTSQVDQIVKGSGLQVIRTPASLSELTKVAAEDGVIFAGAVGGGYVFPDFLPAYDAMASLCKLLELLAPVQQPLSSLVAELPASTLVHRQLPCPWSHKGAVMRVLTERLKGRDLDLLDGIKVSDRRGWAQVLPDPDEPLVHIYAEGRDEKASNELEKELRQLVEEALQTTRPRFPDPRRSRPRRRNLKLRLNLCRAAGLLASALSSERKADRVEPYPDLASMSDADLKALIDRLTEEEQEVSYRRRLLHGRIDMLRTELVARLQKSEGRSVLEEVDVDRLANILAGKAAPRVEEGA